MSKTRARPSKDEILEAEEAAHTPPEPKRQRRKKKGAAEIAEETGLTTADHLPAQLPPPIIEDVPFDPGSHLAAEPSFAERVRGPRHRAPGEPGSVFTSVSGGFKLTENGSERAFQFSDELPPSEDEKAALRDVGMDYRAGRKVWAAQATPDVRERSDDLALRLSGKKDRIEESRGR